MKRTDLLRQLKSGLWQAEVADQDSVKIELVSNRHRRIAGARGQDSSEKEAPIFERWATDPIAQEVPTCSFSNDGPNDKIGKIVQVGESSVTISTNSGKSHASVAALVEAHFVLHLGPGTGQRHSV